AVDPSRDRAYASTRSGWTEITDRTAHGSEATISAAAGPSTACSGIAMRSGSPSATRAVIVASAGPSVMADAYSGGSDTSSRAALISSGTVTSSLASTAASCEAVRTPTIGAATPGRSRTQARATPTGETPSPSAAVATA